MLFLLAFISLFFYLRCTNAAPASPSPIHYPIAQNDFSCNSTTHPNPVILLHGLAATCYEDLNFLQAYLVSLNYCAFSLTYGSYPSFAYVGGLQSIASSSTQIAAFIKTVAKKTGAKKVDLVGHSEGAFMTLYVPKFESGIAALVDHIVAIAPPTRGTPFADLYTIGFIGGKLTSGEVTMILSTIVRLLLPGFPGIYVFRAARLHTDSEQQGCNACNDLGTEGAAVTKLNDGKAIIQRGNKATIIISDYDEFVTPPQSAQVNETGVRNLSIQTACPNDPVGHIGEAYDTNTWNMVTNALDNTPGKSFVCSVGSPARRRGGTP
jgi:pimeloyl-ACP methyl ester carboxylesterase